MFERIVAAIDKDAGRAAKVVEATGELARRFRATALVAHVREIERPTALTTGTDRPGALPEALLFESEEEARRLVDAAVERLRREGVRAEGQVGAGADGSTAKELLAIARAHRASLIVVGDRNSRVSDVLLGGVAHRIVHLADCPVLLVR